MKRLFWGTTCRIILSYFYSFLLCRVKCTGEVAADLHAGLHVEPELHAGLHVEAKLHAGLHAEAELHANGVFLSLWLVLLCTIGSVYT